jgi:hypothetical protein
MLGGAMMGRESVPQEIIAPASAMQPAEMIAALRAAP